MVALRRAAVDYRIRRNKADLESTGYIEIGPGKYAGRHWQDGFLFVPEGAFGMAEGILAKHFPSYDHFDMNDVPKTIGRKVVSEWRDVAARLSGMTADQVHTALNLDAWYRQVDDEIMSHQTEIAKLLTELADALDAFYQRDDWVCVLGM